MCNVQRAEGAPGPGTKACRSLFGPVDHGELSRELHARLREMREESSRIWDFDFLRGVPLVSSRYAWEERGEETVPQFYRTPRPPTTPEPTPPAHTSSHPTTPEPTPPALTSSHPTTPEPTPPAHTSSPPTTPEPTPPALTSSHPTTPEPTPPALTSSPPTTPEPTPPALTSSPPTTPEPTPPALTSSPPTTPEPTPPAHTARPGVKRPQPAAVITDYFPARKKTQVVAALCDKLHSASPIPTEHTPRKMIR